MKLACEQALFGGCEVGSFARAAANSEPLSGRTKGAPLAVTRGLEAYMKLEYLIPSLSSLS